MIETIIILVLIFIGIPAALFGFGGFLIWRRRVVSGLFGVLLILIGGGFVWASVLLWTARAIH
jgi:hypothetical protein